MYSVLREESQMVVGQHGLVNRCAWMLSYCWSFGLPLSPNLASGHRSSNCKLYRSIMNASPFETRHHCHLNRVFRAYPIVPMLPGKTFSTAQTTFSTNFVIPLKLCNRARDDIVNMKLIDRRRGDTDIALAHHQSRGAGVEERWNLEKSRFRLRAVGNYQAIIYVGSAGRGVVFKGTLYALALVFSGRPSLSGSLLEPGLDLEIVNKFDLYGEFSACHLREREDGPGDCGNFEFDRNEVVESAYGTLSGMLSLKDLERGITSSADLSANTPGTGWIISIVFRDSLVGDSLDVRSALCRLDDGFRACCVGAFLEYISVRILHFNWCRKKEKESKSPFQAPQFLHSREYGLDVTPRLGYPAHLPRSHGSQDLAKPIVTLLRHEQRSTSKYAYINYITHQSSITQFSTCDTTNHRRQTSNMFFKTLRRTSKSSASTTTTTTTTNTDPNNKHSMDITRIALGSSSLCNGTIASSQPSYFNTPAIFISAPVLTPPSTVGEYGGTNMEQKRAKGGVNGTEGEEGKDYQEFLEKARREDEEAEKAKTRKVKKARETNMSPWAKRISGEEDTTRHVVVLRGMLGCELLDPGTTQSMQLPVLRSSGCIQDEGVHHRISDTGQHISVHIFQTASIFKAAAVGPEPHTPTDNRLTQDAFEMAMGGSCQRQCHVTQSPLGHIRRSLQSAREARAGGGIARMDRPLVSTRSMESQIISILILILILILRSSCTCNISTRTQSFLQCPTSQRNILDGDRRRAPLHRLSTTEALPLSASLNLMRVGELECT
ncbi:hypothetical protein MBM_09321 [Drepanopeziza brunnea f. sp. 'multigermtubi' MB_m1]|uniref:Uncharacterized protein n=1 Tax=Marssonina brunnea f. sp. multigermtubi (strain MB_m1) TaxID=1072389 RepID=K1W670_MARBU|nr:uncharacterized protein MBM_09321 [Drepanopeziza brunnea f. sp. 'multigermtubi' MB_m1]EKD12455.1 hypothetical protein MBM_09321 [Drepanopeziza brunnea f. sp. 'multigermtubi' MB_m1]